MPPRGLSLNAPTVWLIFLLALGINTQAMAAPEARTYSLNNRPAADIAAQLRDLYPVDQLAVSARGQQMILRAEPAVLDEVGQLVETMDVAPVQMRISVRSGQSGQSLRQGGGVGINNGRVTVQGESRTISTQRNREQNLIVQDGQSAHISSGQVRTIPVAIRGGRNPAAILQQVDFRSGFIVSPQVISDQQIELNVMAFDNDPAQDLPGYKTEAVLTIRRVEPGQWVELGSTETRSQTQREGLTYEVGGSQEANHRYQVKVDVL